MSYKSNGAGWDLTQVQKLVDDLAESLGRSVAVDNPALELVCASAQIGAIDDRRIAAIIDRSSPPEPVPWMLGYGLQDAVDHVRLPANPDFDMLARVCFPVRRNNRLLGYLWLFDEPPVTDEEIEAATALSGTLAGLLGGGPHGAVGRAGRARTLTSDILGGVEGAVARAVEQGYLPEDGALAVQVVRLEGPAARLDAGGQGDDAVLQRLLFELGRVHPLRPFLVSDGVGGVDGKDVLVVVERSRSASESCRVAADLGQAVASTGARVEAVGSSEIESSGVAEGSMRRARFLSEVAALAGLGEQPLSWENAGAWRLLYGWQLTGATVQALSPEAHRLTMAGNADQWRTALSYLDHGRNTTATSASLFIHRATLHYRLQRIRDVVGGVLDDGWSSSAFHIALRLHALLEGRRRDGAAVPTPPALPGWADVSAPRNDTAGSLT